MESDGEMEGPDGVWFASLAKNRGEREGVIDSNFQQDSSPSPSSNMQQRDQEMEHLPPPTDVRRSGRKRTKVDAGRKTRYSDSTKTIHGDAPKSTHRVRNMASEPQLGGHKLSGDNNYAAYEGLLQQMGMVGASNSGSGQHQQSGSSNYGGGNGNGNSGAAASSSFHQVPTNHYVDHSRAYTAPNPTSTLEMNASNLYQRRSSRDLQEAARNPNPAESFAPSSGHPSSVDNSESYSSRGRRHPGLASAPGGQRNMTLKPSNEPASAGNASTSFAQQQQELFGRSRAATMTSGMPLNLGGNVGLDPNSPQYGAVALTASNTSQAAAAAVSSIDPFGSPNTSSISRARSLANFHALHAAQQVARLGEKPDFVLPSHQFRDDVNNQRAAGAVRAALLYGMEQSNESPQGRRKSVTTDPGGIDRIGLQLETPDTPSHPLPQGFNRPRNESVSSQSSSSSHRYGNQWQQQLYANSSNQSGSLGRNSMTTTGSNITPPSSAESRGGPLPDSHPEEVKNVQAQSQNFNRNDALMLDVSQQQVNYGGGYGQTSLLNQQYSSSGFREFVDGSGNNEAWGRIPSWSSSSNPQPQQPNQYSSTGSNSQLGAAYEFPSMNARTQVYGEVYQPPFTSSASVAVNRSNTTATREASPQKMRSTPEMRTAVDSTGATSTSRPIAARGRASSNASRSSKAKSINSNEQGRSSKTPPVPPERISSLRKRKSDAMISSNPRASTSMTSIDSSTDSNHGTPSGIVASHTRTSSSSSISPVTTKSNPKGTSKSPRPNTPGNVSSTHSRQPSSTGGTTFSFVNFGLDDADELCAAVTPSGSYKTPLKNRDQILKNRGKKSRGDDDDEDEEMDFDQQEMEFDQDQEDDEDEGATPTNRSNSKRSNKKRKSESNLNKSAGSASGRRSRTTSNK